MTPEKSKPHVGGNDGSLTPDQIEAALSYCMDAANSLEATRAFIQCVAKHNLCGYCQVALLGSFLVDQRRDLRDVVLWFIERTNQTKMLKDWLEAKDKMMEMEECQPGGDHRAGPNPGD
jgi:hypothetical protein